MSVKQLVDSAVEHLRTRASVKTVYGDPVAIDGKTIIPVAKVAYGFGAGSGPKERVPEQGKAGSAPEPAEGAGGGVAAKPVGVVEISAQQTRFLPFGQTKRVAIAAAVGSALGMVLGLLLSRRRKV